VEPKTVSITGFNMKNRDLRRMKKGEAGRVDYEAVKRAWESVGPIAKPPNSSRWSDSDAPR